jgi:serine/threonine protein kinase
VKRPSETDPVAPRLVETFVSGERKGSGDPRGSDELPRTFTARGGSSDADGVFDRLPIIDPRRYLVDQEHARGGLGRVLRAFDRRLARTVAIKELLHDDGVERFEREARLSAKLQHPAIVPVYEAGWTPEGKPFYVMRLVEGRSLREAIDATRTLDERLALLGKVTTVATAVAYAHDQGVVHRDLKPSNVVVGAFGETVLIDWGLAKVMGDPDDDARSSLIQFDNDGTTTMPGTILGTPVYMAPEQAAGREVDARADV